MYSPFSNQLLAIAVDIGGVPERATALESSVEDLVSELFGMSSTVMLKCV
jgi:hypothetical protein